MDKCARRGHAFSLLLAAPAPHNYLSLALLRHSNSHERTLAQAQGPREPAPAPPPPARPFPHGASAAHARGSSPQARASGHCWPPACCGTAAPPQRGEALPVLLAKTSRLARPLHDGCRVPQPAPLPAGPAFPRQRHPQLPLPPPTARTLAQPLLSAAMRALLLGVASTLCCIVAVSWAGAWAAWRGAGPGCARRGQRRPHRTAPTPVPHVCAGDCMQALLRRWAPWCPQRRA